MLPREDLALRAGMPFGATAPRAPRTVLFGPHPARVAPACATPTRLPPFPNGHLCWEPTIARNLRRLCSQARDREQLGDRPVASLAPVRHRPVPDRPKPGSRQLRGADSRGRPLVG